MLYRGILLSFVGLLVYSIFIFNSEYFIRWFVSDEETELIVVYCRYSIIALYLNSIYINLRVFLNAQSIFNIMIFIQVISTGAHFLACYLSFYEFNFGFMSFIYVRILLELMRVILTLFAIFVLKYGLICLSLPTKLVFAKWLALLKVVVPIGSTVFISFCLF